MRDSTIPTLTLQSEDMTLRMLCRHFGLFDRSQIVPPDPGAYIYRYTGTTVCASFSIRVVSSGTEPVHLQIKYRLTPATKTSTTQDFRYTEYAHDVFMKEIRRGTGRLVNLCETATFTVFRPVPEIPVEMDALTHHLLAEFGLLHRPFTIQLSTRPTECMIYELSATELPRPFTYHGTVRYCSHFRMVLVEDLCLRVEYRIQTSPASETCTTRRTQDCAVSRARLVHDARQCGGEHRIILSSTSKTYHTETSPSKSDWWEAEARHQSKTRRREARKIWKHYDPVADMDSVDDVDVILGYCRTPVVYSEQLEALRMRMDHQQVRDVVAILTRLDVLRTETETENRGWGEVSSVLLEKCRISLRMHVAETVRTAEAYTAACLLEDPLSRAYSIRLYKEPTTTEMSQTLSDVHALRTTLFCHLRETYVQVRTSADEALGAFETNERMTKIHLLRDARRYFDRLVDTVLAEQGSGHACLNLLKAEVATYSIIRGASGIEETTMVTDQIIRFQAMDPLPDSVLSFVETEHRRTCASMHAVLDEYQPSSIQTVTPASTGHTSTRQLVAWSVVSLVVSIIGLAAVCIHAVMTRKPEWYGVILNALSILCSSILLYQIV